MTKTEAIDRQTYWAGRERAMSELAFERGQRVVVRQTGYEAEVIWSDDTWTILPALDEYPPWTQTIDTAFVREKCDLAAPPAIADILRREGKTP